ncbi:MAG TPA: protoporphyrinogen oxidase, partial [Coriobacteriia bacterium]|nr:protoporphyrinogen oxidase [Coriobacteriia bacterium]
MEQEFGSLIKGFLNERKKREAMRAKHPPKPGAKPWAFFNTFHRGMQELTDAMADTVGEDRIMTGTAVTALDRGEDGTWRATLSTGAQVTGDAVIVATEAWAAAPLAKQVDDRVGKLVGSIPCSSSATVPMAFRVEDCPFDLRWFGILSPIVENRPILAVTLTSSKWPDRAPENRVLLRGFVGGPRNQAVMEKSDEELTEIVRKQFVELLGMKPDAQPVFSRVYRWKGGMPQYTLGHLDRVDEIEARSGSIPGFALAGGGYRGVGVPNCIESGERAVSKVLGEWGITLAEDTAPPTRAY